MFDIDDRCRTPHSFNHICEKSLQLFSHLLKDASINNAVGCKAEVQFLLA